MRVLHLAAGNRWTGAAAPAFAEAEALRLSGVDAHYAYVGGYKLEGKLANVEFAHPLIAKAQNPVSFLATVRALASLGRFDVIHAHLTHDHLLALALARRTRARVARTFHSARVLRQDPFSRAMNRSAALLFAVNETFSIPRRTVTFTPPPVDHRQFRPDGGDVRAKYEIAASTPLLAVIGKLAPERGFELALETFASVRTQLSDAKLMIIGHGPHRPALEMLAASLGVADGVLWAGYHEEDLAAHYRAADALLFTERGSDEGHRAVLEAMACGVPPVTAPIAGVDALLRGLGRPLVAATRNAGEIAAIAASVLRDRSAALRSAAAADSQRFGYEAAAARLIAAYDAAL